MSRRHLINSSDVFVIKGITVVHLDLENAFEKKHFKYIKGRGAILIFCEKLVSRLDTLNDTNFTRVETKLKK